MRRWLAGLAATACVSFIAVAPVLIRIDQQGDWLVRAFVVTDYQSRLVFRSARYLADPRAEELPEELSNALKLHGAIVAIALWVLLLVVSRG